MKETLETMKGMLINETQAQIANLQCVDYRELGEAVDMIKDLEEAIYYYTIVEAMEDSSKEEKRSTYYYTERYMPMQGDYYRDMDRSRGRMYYDGTSKVDGGHMDYHETPVEVMRDSREGRSPMSRRTYMESKEMHHDKSKQLKELENYMAELTNDITEMISGASPEEKQLLQKKLTTLSQKIEQMN